MTYVCEKNQSFPDKGSQKATFFQSGSLLFANRKDVTAHFLCFRIAAVMQSFGMTEKSHTSSVYNRKLKIYNMKNYIKVNTMQCAKENSF